MVEIDETLAATDSRCCVCGAGLLMVVCAGGELLTGNAAFMTAALAEKKIKLGDLLKNWVVSYAVRT